MSGIDEETEMGGTEEGDGFDVLGTLVQVASVSVKVLGAVWDLMGEMGKGLQDSGGGQNFDQGSWG